MFERMNYLNVTMQH